jgi:3-oxoacyl-(acyl-carrier-protein) reductase
MGVLSGQAGLVTGASRGIGRAIALELARNGAHIAVGYSANEDAANAVVAEISALGVDAVAVKGNVAVPEQVQPAVDSVAARFGRLDFLVNNAGINRDRTLAKMTPELWNEVIDVNLHSVFNVTSVVLEHMLHRGYGRIVNISSVVGQTGNFGQTNYSTAKAGMIGFTKSAALELAQRGITVNCIAPGFVATDMVDGMPADAQKRALERIPMGRFGKPEEIAQAALFLIAFGDYVTGQVIAVNGGMYM